MVEERLKKHFDYTLLATVLLIAGIGSVMILSASHTEPSGSKYMKKQVIWLILGLICMGVAAVSDYRVMRRYSKPIYTVNIILLLIVDLLGRSAKGSQRWIPLGFFDLQPSEIAKVALIITLATYLLANQDRIKEFEIVFKSLVHIGFPTLLILKQPDLGTSLVLIVIWFCMLFITGAKKRHLLVFVVLGIAGFALMWHTGILKDYQKSRITSFIDPSSDPRATGYHVKQSLVAIGSGEVFGKGLFHGSQNRLHFIPEQHTDFIFTVVGEEFGFVGSITLLILYCILLLRILQIMAEAEDPFGRLIASGIFAFFTFHVIENIGMTVGIMPVAGVPLPFMSYGGSSLMVNMAAIGLLESIHLRRHKIMF